MSNTVPEGWDNTKLGDVISSVISGQSPNRKDHPAMPGKYGILKTTAIDWGKYSPIKNQEVLDGYKVNLKHEVRAGDILITKAGPVHRVGVVAYVEKSPSNMLVSGKMTLLRAQKGHDPRFLSYALSTDYSQKPLKESTTGMAASQTNFTHDTLLGIPVWVPGSLPEQQKIAAILSSVDDVIEKTRAQIDKLKDLKTGMMQELLTKGIGSGGVPHTEFKDSPVGRIPEGWDVKTLGEIASLQRGHDLTQANSVIGQYPVISSSGVSSYHNEFTTPGPGVIVGRKGSIGRVHYTNSDYWAHDTSLYVKDFHGNDVLYVYYLFVYLDLQKFGTKSGSPSLNRNDLHPLKVAVPPLVEQTKISNMLANIDEKTSSCLVKLEHLLNLKKALMQDLLTGKVRVKIDQKESAVS